MTTAGSGAVGCHSDIADERGHAAEPMHVHCARSLCRVVVDAANWPERFGAVRRLGLPVRTRAKPRAVRVALWCDEPVLRNVDWTACRAQERRCGIACKMTRGPMHVRAGR
jgi:hypothetical protein